MTWIITFSAIIAMWLDYLFIQRIPMGESKRNKWIFSLMVINSLPTVISISTYLFSPDNIHVLSDISRWAMFLFVVLGLARQPFNIAYLVSKNKLIRSISALCSLTAAAICLHGMAITRTDYIINKVVITSDRLPESFDNYRIVQFSDLHIGTLTTPQKEIPQIVKLCNSLQPDIVAFTGDLVDTRYNELQPSIKSALKQLNAKDGIYAIMGNHDIGVYIRDSIRLTPKENTRRLIATEQELGWQVLDNQTEYIRRNADSISITGITFSQALQEKRHSSNLPQVNIEDLYINIPKECYNITLSHIPQLWDNILSHHPTDLTLAGHVHAMQIAAKVGQWRLSPSMLLYKRWSGLYVEQGKYLYVNDGIGYTLYPMRIGARPEITLFELKCKK